MFTKLSNGIQIFLLILLISGILTLVDGTENLASAQFAMFSKSLSVMNRPVVLEPKSDIPQENIKFYDAQLTPSKQFEKLVRVGAQVKEPYEYAFLKDNEGNWFLESVTKKRVGIYPVRKIRGEEEGNIIVKITRANGKITVLKFAMEIDVEYIIDERTFGGYIKQERRSLAIIVDHGEGKVEKIELNGLEVFATVPDLQAENLLASSILGVTGKATYKSYKSSQPVQVWTFKHRCADPGPCTLPLTKFCSSGATEGSVCSTLGDVCVIQDSLSFPSTFIPPMKTFTWLECQQQQECKPLQKGFKYNNLSFKDHVNIVFVPSGFDGDMNLFKQKAEYVWSILPNYLPFSGAVSKLNGFYVSKEDNRIGCNFESSWTRHLFCNIFIAKQLSSACTSGPRQTVVIHNNNEFSGTGYFYEDVAIISGMKIPGLAGLAAHELGHSLFNLGDEYPSQSLSNPSNSDNCDYSSCTKWDELIGTGGYTSVGTKSWSKFRGVNGVDCRGGSCGNGNFYTSEFTIMKAIGEPFEEVNLRSTCCIYYQETGEFPSYCSQFDQGFKYPSGLKDFCGIP